MTILIAARHPSAAGGVVALRSAARRRGIRVEVFASGPAWPILQRQRWARLRSFATVPVRYPRVPEYTGAERIDPDAWRHPAAALRRVELMVAWLGEYLKAVRPSVVVLTDATEQLGADQLLAIAASRAGIPSVRVRDAWGTAAGLENSSWRGVVPDAVRREALATRYLEIDARGVTLSAARLGIGRPRLRAVHGLFTLDRLVGRATPARRMRARRRLGLHADEKLIVYFVQPTRRETAEPDALDAFLSAANAAGLGSRKVVLATQEHPREADPSDGRLGLHWAAKQAAAVYRGRVVNLTPLVLERAVVSFEDTQLASDVFASSYSNASVEATALGAGGRSLSPAQRPIGLHVTCPAAVRRVVRANRSGMSVMPFAESGAVPCARQADTIAPLVTDLLFRPTSRTPYFRAMHKRWRLGACADQVMNEVCDVVGRS